ncbi:phosphatase PAP2 family protein [Vagococcus xieshaowenii]|uniref:Phosphatase PAP2 family protein n=1 Tax=Vagococcus xieshaowenii TaxID=2562451 RepID=A0AAJ5EGC9_9ENTE|nr:phosphatase PAP2 family protein [Vagococcus xieshaowenii]QCA28418.1 phosphatase PAP2 family protein [Vagococcus xieshaowenii]TFZ42826.1 phosphatase PAP2 family protein [Vagococcus xieshaowenii]
MILLLLISLVIFIGMIRGVKHNQTTQLDEQVMTFALSHRTFFWTVMMKLFTELGKPIPIAIICLSNYFYFSKDTIFGKQLIITVIVGMVAAYFVKISVKRTRPDEHRLVQEKDYSFPSYHALGAAMVYFSIAAESINYGLKHALMASIICVICFFMIGYSRVYLGIHYISDVIAGWSLGVMIVCLVNFYYAI